MTITPRSPRLILALAAGIVAALCIAAVLPASGQGAGRTTTIRAFSKAVSITVTHPDGTVVTEPPLPEVAPGDVLDVYSLDFRGDHRRHAERPFGSEHLRCVFGTGEPDCVSHTAIGGSLLVFRGNPGTLIGGTGRFEGATGRVVSNTEVPGGNDIVTKIELARR